jgi:hypothetical protein
MRIGRIPLTAEVLTAHLPDELHSARNKRHGSFASAGGACAFVLPPPYAGGNGDNLSG